MNLDIKIYSGDLVEFFPSEANIKEKRKSIYHKANNDINDIKKEIKEKKDDEIIKEGEKEILNKNLELHDKKDDISENKEKKEEQIKNSEEEIKADINNKNKEKIQNIIYDNETVEKINTMFQSIKNFDQLKNEVYQMRKHFEYLNQITMKSLEEKQQTQLNLCNQKFSDLNKKFELLMGDIKPKDLDYNNLENEGEKAMNLSDLNTRLKTFQYSKADITDLNQLNEDFDFKFKELSKRLTELKLSIFGTEKHESIINEQENKQDKSNDKLNDKVNDKINDKVNDKLIDNQNKDNKNDITFKKLTFAPKNEFDKFKTKTEDEFNKIWKEIDNLRLIFGDIKDTIKDKTSYNDLEELKNVILQKTEELFLNQNKKSINYTSSLKILQDNFKKLLKLLSDKEQYLENNKYQMENNPIRGGGGHSCASCENFIGDLKMEHKFVNWNKFPKKQKDNTEIFKRVQNGYSRFLQMINFDSNGNPSFNPYTNSINNETNISSNLEDNTAQSKEKNEINHSFINKRLFSSKVKKIFKHKNNTIELINTKREEIITKQKLPFIKTSKSIDNFQKLKYDTNQHINKKEINFITPVFSRNVQESNNKNT